MAALPMNEMGHGLRSPQREARSSRLELTQSAVHVWSIPLTATESEYASLVGLLDAGERSRGQRFLSDAMRRRFVVGRARLRHLLGAYLGVSPNEVTLAYGNQGKPFVPQSDDPGSLQFNFSNSSDLAIAAFTLDQDLGVDVEWLRSVSNVDGLVRRFFAREEIEQVLGSRDSDARLRAFFRCWTRKEAYLKAVGKGLTFPLDQVCVTVDEEPCVRIVGIGGDAAAAAQWQLESLALGEECVGALALRTGGDRRPIEYHHWVEL